MDRKSLVSPRIGARVQRARRLVPVDFSQARYGTISGRRSGAFLERGIISLELHEEYEEAIRGKGISSSTLPY